MSTVRDLITASLQESGVYEPGHELYAEDADGAFSVLNRFVDFLATQKLSIYQVTRTTWTITTGDGTYSVGTGSDVNVARPTFIEGVGLVETSTTPDTETPLQLLTDSDWREVTQKESTGVNPAYYRYTPTYPLGTIELWPVPTSTTLLGALYAPLAVAKFASLDTVLALPPGYEEMLITNLAVRRAPAYHAQVSPELREAARKSLEAVFDRNRKPVGLLAFDPAVLFGSSGGSFDIYRGA